MSKILDYKAEISKLEEAIAQGRVSQGAALVLLAQSIHDHFSAVLGEMEHKMAEERRLFQLGGGRTDQPGVAPFTAAAPAAPVRVSFRKNVQIEPYKYEHAEVWVDLNGSSLAEATQAAKDACDQVLGVSVVDDDDLEYAKDVLRRAKKSGKLKSKQAERELEKRLDELFGDD